MHNHERSSLNLAALIPAEEMKRVMDSDASIEIDPSCLTCLDYAPLAEIIPLHWVVVDFGCSYNAQSYLFKQHKRLISIDLPFNRYEQSGMFLERFKPEWCELHEIPIDNWLDTYLKQMDLDETFAICGYVPAPEQVERIRHSFRNLFVFYPSCKEEWGELFKYKPKSLKA